MDCREWWNHEDNKGEIALVKLLRNPVTPFRSLLDRDMSIGIFALMSIGYVILSAVMGIKLGCYINYQEQYG